MRYLDHDGNATEIYPHNRTVSPDGITGLTTPDGRFTIMMPHPERVFRSVQMSWRPEGLGEHSPWFPHVRQRPRLAGFDPPVTLPRRRLASGAVRPGNLRRGPCFQCARLFAE